MGLDAPGRRLPDASQLATHLVSVRRDDRPSFDREIRIDTAGSNAIGMMLARVAEAIEPDGREPTSIECA